MRFCINKIWYDERHIEALKLVRPEGWKLRRRARGYRFGRRDYHQSFPLRLCAYFSQYCEPANIPWEKRGEAIIQAEFRGFTDSGKPILRCRA